MRNLALAAITAMVITHGGLGLATETTTPDTSTTRLTPLQVTASSLIWGSSALTADDLRQGRGDNLAEDLELLPGIAAVRRAASASELVIRGLGWERVQTVLGAVPLYGACPGRMDPPATYLGPLSVQQVSLTRQGGGAFAGPGGTGGAVIANPDYERASDAEAGTMTWLGANFESAREGYRYEGGLFGGTRQVDYSFGAGHHHTEDYTAPDGTIVPAGQTNTSLNGSLGWRPDANRRLWYAGSYAREENVEFPALPMDNIKTDFSVHNVGYRVSHTDGLVRRISLTGGISAIDHLMDNSLKPNRGMMEAATAADTRSAAAHAVFTLAPGDGWQIRTGLDATRLHRDATRTRLITTNGMTYRDRLWPDAVQVSFGGLAALTSSLSPATALTLNGRLDVIDSKARAADMPSLGGKTVREQYVNYYGTDAAQTDRSETLGQVQLGLTREVSARGRLFLRTGLSTRPGGITERFYAFGPAPGGFQVGDPSLSAEKKWEGEVGGEFQGEHMVLMVSAFHAAVSDFILPTVIDRRDVNGDTIDDTIKGFANVDGTLTGGEIGLEYRPLPSLYLPVTVSYVRGHNTTDDRDLPEMPPLFGTAEVRFKLDQASGTWLNGGCTFAADQDKVDPLFPEDRTGGYAIWHLGAESAPVAGWRLSARVDNLFDRLYNDHLTREAVLPVGGLTAGQEVPAPGRSATVAARVEF